MPVGRILEEEIIKTKELRKTVSINQYIIMPNHVHMIIEINNKGTIHCVPTMERFKKPTSNTIPTIVRYIKAAVTRRNRKIYYTDNQIWQRNYYEHIIRNKQELYEILQYMEYNPINWKKDILNINKERVYEHERQ